MSHPANVLPFPPPAKPVAPTRDPFPFDAAIPDTGSAAYVPTMPFAFAMTTWAEAIRQQRLSDEQIPSLHALAVDPRDGALCRGQGGACYTPHAWSQLVSLMRGQGAPAGLGNAFRWLSPLARHFAWLDLTAKSLRPRVEEGIMRMMWVKVRRGDSGLTPVMRAVVSGRHSLTHFDDSAVLKVIGSLEETPVRARISRGWDETHATFDLDGGDSDIALSFYMRNSETGCASLGFASALRLAVLDATVVMPSGDKYERVVRIAAKSSANTRRRHTLPRYSGSSGSRLSETARAAIASRRIGDDIETALAGSRLLAQRWERARQVIDSRLVPIAKATAVADDAVMVLADVLLELGFMREGVKVREDVDSFARDVATVMAEDARLQSLPHGSLAHLAAAFAVLATTPKADGSFRTWDYALELQRLSGKVLMSIKVD